ncbi:hypothetical protein PEC106568_15770 [Pectobacterium carotovorum subsp. carotovorum]|nr:hypothetical protein PEC106568_15770 [Pectobacterium carotovorum subsp. carotovorum]
MDYLLQLPNNLWDCFYFFTFNNEEAFHRYDGDSYFFIYHNSHRF